MYQIHEERQPGQIALLIPAMLVILFLLTALRAPIERSVDA